MRENALKEKAGKHQTYRLVLLCLCLAIGACSSSGGPSIQIPSLGTLFSVPNSSGHYTVKSGDSVYAIAQRYGVSNRALIQANNLKAPYILRVGQKLIIPGKTGYAVKSGDTLYGIALEFDVGLHDLARANNLKSPYRIFPGQRLIIPQSSQQVVVVDKDDRQNAVQTSSSSSLSTKRTWPRPPIRPDHAPRLASVSKPKPKPVPKPDIVTPNRSAAGFSWPIQGRVISSYGAKGQGLYNDGINIAAPKGTAVKASENGVVAYSGSRLQGFGNMILVRHSGGYMTAYAHNERNLVKTGDTVNKGQIIARVGSSGNVDSPQLHFQIRKGKKTLDPRKELGTRSAGKTGIAIGLSGSLSHI